MITEGNKKALQDEQSLVTWIIPVYNGEKYIEQAVKSILNQPCKDLKVLIIDDGSTDSTNEIIKEIKDERVRYVYKMNAGVSAARNYGVKCVDSKYIAFLDADDSLCKNIYDNELHSLLMKSQYELLSFAYFEGDQNLRRGNRRNLEAMGESSCDEAKLSCFKHVSSFIFSRRFLEKDKPLMFPEGIRYREDVTFLFLVLCKGRKLLNIDRELFIYRNNSSSVLHSFTTYDHLIEEAVSAWQWCKKQCSLKREMDACDARLFADAVDYIRNSCLIGISVSEIQRKLKRPEIEAAVQNYEALWNDRKVIYEQFVEHPHEYWKKMRRKGVMQGVMRRAARIAFIRWFYFRQKYKMNIRAFV